MQTAKAGFKILVLKIVRLTPILSVSLLKHIQCYTIEKQLCHKTLFPIECNLVVSVSHQQMDFWNYKEREWF